MSQPTEHENHTRSDDLDGIPVGPPDGHADAASSAPCVSHHAFAHAAATTVVRPPPAPARATVTAGAHAKSTPSTAGVHAKSTPSTAGVHAKSTSVLRPPFSARGATSSVPRPSANVPSVPSSAISKAPSSATSKAPRSATSVAPRSATSKGIAPTPTQSALPSSTPCASKYGVNSKSAPPSGLSSLLPGTMVDFKAPSPLLPGSVSVNSKAPAPPMMHGMPQVLPGMPQVLPDMPPMSMLPGNAVPPLLPNTAPPSPYLGTAPPPPPAVPQSAPSSALLLPGVEPPPQGSVVGAQLLPGMMMPGNLGVCPMVPPIVWPTPPLAWPTSGMVPIPGMAPMTIPMIPPVPGMPTVPLTLGLTVQIPKVEIPVERWEEFEAEEYGITYYYNRSKDISAWEAPEGCRIIRAKKVHIGLVDSWETVGDKSWVRVKTTTGLYYFHNKETDGLEWECPADIVDLVRALDEKEYEQEFEIPDDDSEPEFEIPEEDNQEVASLSDASDSESSESPEMKEILALRKKLEDFQELLQEKGIVGGPMRALTYERAIPKLCNEPRFLAIANNERRGLFDSTVKKLKESLSKDTAEKRTERINQFRKLLQEKEVHHVIQEQCREPIDIILMSLLNKIGEDPRWKALDPKERKRVTQEAVEKIAIDVEAMRKIEREKFAAQVETYFARCKKDELPIYVKARKDLGPLVFFTDQEQERIYHTLLMRRRDMLNTRSKRQRELLETQSELDSHRLKRKRLEDDEELIKLFFEKCKNPWAPKASWKDFVDKSKLDKSKEELENLWSKFKEKLVDQRQRLFLQQLRATFDREKTFHVKDINGVVEELNIPALSCVPEKYLTDVMRQFDEEITKDTEQAFTQYLRTCEHFANAGALEVRGPVFEALLNKLSTNTLYKRLDSRPKERAEMVRAWIEEVKKIKAVSKVVLEE